LGIYRLDHALAQFEHADAVTVVYRAYELNPNAPPSLPFTMSEAVARKYGISREQAESGHERLTALGREVGMDFHFERIKLGSTFDAHRLTRAALGSGREDVLVKGIFAARFTDGRLLSDPAVLLEVAATAGLDIELARGVVESDAEADEVRADEAAARELDVMGVPHFLINGRWPIPGAQDIETFVLILRRAWERTEATEDRAS
jgi:protein disulfide-isomerase